MSPPSARSGCPRQLQAASSRPLHLHKAAGAPSSASLRSTVRQHCREAPCQRCTFCTAYKQQHFQLAGWTNPWLFTFFSLPVLEEIKTRGENTIWFSWITSFSPPKGFNSSFFFYLLKAPGYGNSLDKTFPKENPIISFKNMEIKILQGLSCFSSIWNHSLTLTQIFSRSHSSWTAFLRSRL